MSKKNTLHNNEQELSQNTARALALSEEFKMKGENMKALQIAEKILEKDPSCVQAAEEVADNLLALGKNKEAKKAAEFAYKLNEKSYVANYILGFTTLDNTGEALKYLEQANESSPHNPEILRCLGWSLFHGGKRPEGIATLERALNIRPTDPLILCDLGVCFLHLSIFDKAIKLFKKALSLDPNNKRAQECLKASQDIKRNVEEEMKNMPKDLQKLIENNKSLE